jgi:hypothetical protein
MQVPVAIDGRRFRKGFSVILIFLARSNGEAVRDSRYMDSDIHFMAHGTARQLVSFVHRRLRLSWLRRGYQPIHWIANPRGASASIDSILFVCFILGGDLLEA